MRTLMKQGLQALLLALAGANAAIAADAFPAKPIRVVVSSAPGGLLDQHVRAVAQKMSEKLGQPMVVENRSGADGLLAIRSVKSAPADGYTLLATTDTISIQAGLRGDPGYNLEKDFIGVGPISRSPFVLVTGTGQPDKTLADFVTRAKANPGQLTYASGGVGTAAHLPAVLLSQQMGLKLLHVPYKGNALAMPDISSGRVNVIFAGAQQLRTGRLRPLGVSSLRRMPAFPDIPTLAEQGVTNFDYHIVIGLLAPADTPKDTIQRLSETMRSVSTNEELRRYMNSEGSELAYSSPEEYTALLKQIMLQVRKLAPDIGLPKE